MAKEFSDSDDELRQLYLSFTKAVEEGGDLMEFSSDDLLDIFDYALRGADEATAGDAVIEGLRRAPHDSDFIKRKGFLFHEIDNDEACERVFAQLPEDAFVRIALLMRNSVEREDVDEIISRSLNDFSAGSVEEWDIVFLVDIFDNIDRVDLLVRHAEEISRVSQIPEAVYSELYSLFYDKRDYKSALEICKKLCDLNAFDAVTWTELAHLYLMKFGDTDMAVESAEYALAIEPENLTALMLKSIALHGSDPQEARNIVSQVLRKNPDEPMALFASGCIELLDGNESVALARLNESLAGFNKSQRREAMDLALRYMKRMENSTELIRNLSVVLLNDQEINCSEWLENLIRLEAYCGALCLATAAIEAGRLDLSMLSVITAVCEALYRMEHYDDLRSFIKDIYPDRADWKENMPAIIMAIYAVTLYRIGEITELRDFLEEAVEASSVTPRGINVQERIFLRANLSLLLNLREALDHLPEPPDETMFDPFNI